MRKERTVAIIGSGVAGLAAARALCLRGVAVKLYEANNKLGGCCATTRIDGFTFNDGALFLAFPRLLDHLFERLELDRPSLLPLRHITALQRTVLADGSVVTFDREAGIVVEGDGAATATAREDLRRFLTAWDPLLQVFADDILLHPLSLWRLVAGGGRHLHLLRGTAASHLNHAFHSEAVRAAILAALSYTALPPARMPAAALLGIAAMFSQGYFAPVGGMGRIPETLGQAVREVAGEIHLNTHVNRIVVDNGRACAVDVNAEGILNVDAVISTTSGMHTVRSLLAERDAPPRMVRKARRAALSHKGFALQLGLSNPIDATSYSNNRPLLDYMVPTVAAPELAPAGGSIVEMFPPIPQNLRPEEWSDERKDDVAAQAIERLKGVHRIAIATRRIVSPKEFQNDRHLFAGALYGVTPLASPTTLFSHRSPIAGLYQCGQTTWPGFGIATAALSGVIAADALIRTERWC